MTSTNPLTVDFHGHQLVTLESNGTPVVAMKPICESIGLDWRSQLQRIKRHPVLCTSVVMMTTQNEGDDQRRETTFLPLKLLNGWLFSVDANRVKPEIREALLMYQAECFDVLSNYWMGIEGEKARYNQAEFDMLNTNLNAVAGHLKCLTDFWYQTLHPTVKALNAKQAFNIHENLFVMRSQLSNAQGVVQRGLPSRH